MPNNAATWFVVLRSIGDVAAMVVIVLLLLLLHVMTRLSRNLAAMQRDAEVLRATMSDAWQQRHADAPDREIRR